MSVASLLTETFVIMSLAGLSNFDVVFAKTLNVKRESTSARLFESKRNVSAAFDERSIGLPIVHAIVVLLKLLHTPVLCEIKEEILNSKTHLLFYYFKLH